MKFKQIQYTDSLKCHIWSNQYKCARFIVRRFGLRYNVAFVIYIKRGNAVEMNDIFTNYPILYPTIDQAKAACNHYRLKKIWPKPIPI